MISSISFYQFSSVQSLSRVQLFVTPWTAAHQLGNPVKTKVYFLRQNWWEIEWTMLVSIRSKHKFQATPLITRRPHTWDKDVLQAQNSQHHWVTKHGPGFSLFINPPKLTNSPLLLIVMFLIHLSFFHQETPGLGLLFITLFTCSLKDRSIDFPKRWWQ